MQRYTVYLYLETALHVSGGGMAAELSGNYRAALGSGDTPAKMMSKAFSAGKAIAGAIAKAKSGDAAGAANDAQRVRDTVGESSESGGNSTHYQERI